MTFIAGPIITVKFAYRCTRDRLIGCAHERTDFRIFRHLVFSLIIKLVLIGVGPKIGHFFLELAHISPWLKFGSFLVNNPFPLEFVPDIHIIVIAQAINPIVTRRIWLGDCGYFDDLHMYFVEGPHLSLRVNSISRISE